MPDTLDMLDTSASPVINEDHAQKVSAYQAQQERIVQRSVRCVDEHPHLIGFNPDKPKVRGVTLAAKNARILLKQAFPTTVFSVRCDRSSAGTELLVEWTAWPGEPDLEHDSVLGVVSVFKNGAYRDENYEYDLDEERQAFRRAFGSTTYVRAQARPPTPQEAVDHEKAVLNATLKDMGPSSRTPRARL